MSELNEIYLLKYLQGECTEQEYAVINKWLNESQNNHKILFDLEIAYHLPQKQRYSEPSFLNKAQHDLMRRIEATEQLETKKRVKQTLKRIIQYSAAAIITIAAVGAVFTHRDVVNNDIVISVLPGDSIKDVTLPDGSRVWINQSSTLRYPKVFSESKRSVYLDGEAYFEVTKNPASPFTVTSKTVSITVLGTTFNLKCSADNTFAEATLIDGEISIKGNNDEGQIVLLPGQKAEVDILAKRMTVKTVNAQLNAVWHNNLIPFSKASLQDIMNTLEQLYDINIVLADGVDITNYYSGVICKKDSIENVLNSLMNSIPIIYEIKNNHIYIKQNFSAPQ